MNVPALARWAREHDCLVAVRQFVGEFVQERDVMIEVYGGSGDIATAERTLCGLVALGIERTIKQDPAFALRVMVDVANKALSAAIDDPTTAVQVLDHLGDSLSVLGNSDPGTFMGPWHGGSRSRHPSPALGGFLGARRDRDPRVR